MLKLPNSIEPAVMAENIVHLRDGLAAVDAKTLPETGTATTGQILKLTGETKTPAWADEYSYTPPAYSTTETAIGQKWIDGKEIYAKVFSDTFPEITSTGSQILGTISDVETLVSASITAVNSTNTKIALANIIAIEANGRLSVGSVTNSYSEKPYNCILYYTKVDPTPGRSPEDSDQEPEVKKTTKKKTTK